MYGHSGFVSNGKQIEYTKRDDLVMIHKILSHKLSLPEGMHFCVHKVLSEVRLTGWCLLLTKKTQAPKSGITMRISAGCLPEWCINATRVGYFLETFVAVGSSPKQRKGMSLSDISSYCSDGQRHYAPQALSKH